jgi:hypothetical protein
MGVSLKEESDAGTGNGSLRLGVVAHSCNPSYTGVRGRRIVVQG